MQRLPLASVCLTLLLAACASAPAANGPTAAAPTLPPIATQAPARTNVVAAPTVAAPTVAPTVAAPTVAVPTVAVPTVVAPTVAAPTGGSEILFLRGGQLFAYAVASAVERPLASAVSAVAASDNGQQLALVRENEIWVMGRDGAGAQQLTTNDRFESGLAYAADGLSLAYTSSPVPAPQPFDRLSWAEWCRISEVRLLDLRVGSEGTISPGCDVALAPDSQRLAYASPPASGAPQTASNEIRVVNRQGQNGWAFASSIGAEPERGLLVYAPAFSPDGTQLAYQRYMGNQVESEIMYMQAAPLWKGGGDLLALGIGWLTPLRYSPDGRMAVAVEYNYDDARGFAGYEVWRAVVLRLDTPGETFAPSGTLPTTADDIERLPRATAAVWSPAGDRLAVLLPAGWLPDQARGEPLFGNEAPGEIRLWQPGAQPGEPLIANVDYATPVLWLP